MDVAEGFDAFRKQILTVTTNLLDKRLTQAKNAVRKAARTEANKIFHWLAAEMRNHLDSPPSELFEFVPTWEGLSDRNSTGGAGSYFDFKVNRSGGTQDFFHVDGDLAKELDKGSTPAQVFGDPLGEFNEGQTNLVRSFPLNMSFENQGNQTFKITIDLFPRLPEDPTDRTLAILVANGSSNPDKVWGELMNRGRPGGPVRPILAPALLYFAKYRIPQAIEIALAAHGFKGT